jgi:hypothetical protein
MTDFAPVAGTLPPGAVVTMGTSSSAFFFDLVRFAFGFFDTRSLAGDFSAPVGRTTSGSGSGSTANALSANVAVQKSEMKTRASFIGLGN